MAKYVYSKLANDNVFTRWVSGGKGKAPARKEQILIKGGAGVANKVNLETPLGVVTKVKDEEAKFLMENKNFQRQMKAGFISIEDSQVEVEKVVDSMTDKRDNSDQDNESDFEKPPVTNKEENK